MNNESRQFKCPCGKTYKSYPALHTHIKRKHDGEAPGLLHLPHNNLVTRRGRPAVEMHKIQPEEIVGDLEALTTIELGLLSVIDILKDPKAVLTGNTLAALDFEHSHPYLFK